MQYDLSDPSPLRTVVHNHSGATKDMKRASHRLLELTIEELTAAMDDHDITRTELARRLNVSVQNLTSLFSGDRNLTLRTISNVATALGFEAVVTLRYRNGKERSKL